MQESTKSTVYIPFISRRNRDSRQCNSWA